MMPNAFRRTAGWLAASILATLAVLALAQSGSARAPANPSTTTAATLAPGALAPTEAQRATARKIGRILEEAHYSRAPIDKKMSEQVFNRYLDFLDGQRSYFLASDIADFQAYKFKFDDMIRTGDVEPAYVIFARFQQRNRERVQHAIELLQTEPDWNSNETFEFERQKAAWPANEAELNELWRKRVKNDALSLLLTGKQWPEVTDLLRKRYERVLKRVDQITSEDVFENLDERLRALLRSAFELLLPAELGGIPNSDEPQLRGHRRIAPTRGRLRDDHERDRGRPCGGGGHAQHE